VEIYITYYEEMNCQFVYQKTGRNCTNIPTGLNKCCKTHSSYYNKLCRDNLRNPNYMQDNNINDIGDNLNDTIIIDENVNPIISFFTSKNNNFTYVIDNDIIYFNGIEISMYFGYANHNKAVRDHVFPRYVKKLREIYKTASLNKNSGNTLFISEYGLYQLLAKSKLQNENIENLRDILYEIILPRSQFAIKLRASITGSKIDNAIPLNIPQLSLYDRKNVIYIGYIPSLTCYKFGISHDIISRNECYVKIFGSFNTIYVKECNNNNYVAMLFKSDLKNLNLLHQHESQTECFKTTMEYDVNYVTNLLDNILDSQIYQSNLYTLELKKLELQLKIKQEETKIKQEETKHLELQLKLKQLDLVNA
jgi:hypothetical protein